MDVLTDVLESLRLSSTLYCRTDLHAPWSLYFAATRPATFHVVAGGNCWLHIDGEEAVQRLAGGDLIVLPHGTGHLISTVPNAAPIVSIQLDQNVPNSCQIRAYPGAGVPTQLLCGLFDFARDNGHPLLALLPPLIHLRGEQGQALPWLESTLSLLASEAGSRRPGTDTLVRRLTDVLFIQIIRAWLEASPDHPGGWLSALRDPQIGAALSLIHQGPEREWTVATLATATAMSRSAFAARFRSLVGTPPLQYLTNWRMQLAARLIERGELGLHEVAQQVGYDSDVALSKAFKRTIGVAPGVYRRHGLARAAIQHTDGLPLQP